MVKINDKFKNLIPSLSKDEYKQLEENILQEGIRDAIVTWDNYIIDGHNRYEISQKHNLEYKVIEKEFENENEVIIWIIHNQLGRRNINDYTRGELALQLESVFKEKAKLNLELSGKLYGEKHKKTQEGSQNSVNPLENIDTQKETAKIANVSHDTISKIKKISETLPEEVKQELRNDDISINKAYGIVKQVKEGTKEIDKTIKQTEKAKEEHDANIKKLENEKAKELELEKQNEQLALQKENEQKRMRELEAKLEKERKEKAEIEAKLENERKERDELAKKISAEEIKKEKEEKEKKIQAKKQMIAELKSKNYTIPNLNNFNFIINSDILSLHREIPNGIKVLLTDPPYGMNFISNRRLVSEKDMGIVNDGDLNNALNLLDKTLSIITSKMLENSFAFIFCCWKYEPDFRKIFEKYFKLRNSLIWVKNNHGSGDIFGSFAPKHERILFGVKGNPKLNYRLPDVLNGNCKETAHPTSKPIDLLMQLIKVSSNDRDLIIDPFCGHGSTILASLRTNREVFGVEIDYNNYITTIQNINKEINNA